MCRTAKIVFENNQTIQNQENCESKIQSINADKARIASKHIQLMEYDAEYKRRKKIFISDRTRLENDQKAIISTKSQIDRTRKSEVDRYNSALKKANDRMREFNNAKVPEFNEYAAFVGNVQSNYNADRAASIAECESVKSVCPQINCISK